MPKFRPSSTAARRAPVALLSMCFLFLLSACGDHKIPAWASSDPATTPTDSTPGPSSRPPPASGPSAGTSSVTLNWSAPSQNTDGSPLTDLAGYRVYYSQAPWAWTDMLDVRNPSATSIEVPNLSTGTTWYFALATYNAAGVESERTAYVSKML